MGGGKMEELEEANRAMQNQLKHFHNVLAVSQGAADAYKVNFARLSRKQIAFRDRMAVGHTFIFDSCWCLTGGCTRCRRPWWRLLEGTRRPPGEASGPLEEGEGGLD
jgi:hypothetical protein